MFRFQEIFPLKKFFTGRDFIQDRQTWIKGLMDLLPREVSCRLIIRQSKNRQSLRRRRLQLVSLSLQPFQSVPKMFHNKKTSKPTDQKGLEDGKKEFFPQMVRSKVAVSSIVHEYEPADLPVKPSDWINALDKVG